jgi:hypothetical protein
MHSDKNVETERRKKEALEKEKDKKKDKRPDIITEDERK